MPLVDFSDEEFLIVEYYLRSGVEVVTMELCSEKTSKETRAAARVNRAAHRLANELKEWWEEQECLK